MYKDYLIMLHMFVQEKITLLKLFFNELFVKIINLPELISFTLFFSIIFFLLMFKFLKRFNLFLFLLSFPATFFHELSHFIVSFILFGKPNKISLFPQKTENGWILGYVESHNLNWFNQSFVALSPLLLFPIGILFLEYSLLEDNLQILFFKGYLIANLFYGMTPSSTDFRLAFQQPIPILLFTILIVLSFYKG